MGLVAIMLTLCMKIRRRGLSDEVCEALTNELKAAILWSQEWPTLEMLKRLGTACLWNMWKAWGPSCDVE